MAEYYIRSRHFEKVRYPTRSMAEYYIRSRHFEKVRHTNQVGLLWNSRLW